MLICGELCSIFFVFGEVVGIFSCEQMLSENDPSSIDQSIVIGDGPRFDDLRAKMDSSNQIFWIAEEVVSDRGDLSVDARPLGEGEIVEDFSEFGLTSNSCVPKQLFSDEPRLFHEDPGIYKWIELSYFYFSNNRTSKFLLFYAIYFYYASNNYFT